MNRIKKALTFSNAIALTALFFALGGTVYAAAGKIDGAQIKAKSLPGNRLKAKSVGAAQLKSGAIGSAQIKAGSVTGKQLAAGAVGEKQIQAGAVGEKQIKAGSVTGAQVKPGSLGATQINQTTLTGISAANVHTVQYASVTIGLNKDSESGSNGTAACPPGMKVIGGGATTSNPVYSSVFESAPSADRNGWFAAGFSSIAGNNMTITAICTPVATSTG
jgi:hypothetical protein